MAVAGVRAPVVLAERIEVRRQREAPVGAIRQIAQLVDVESVQTIRGKALQPPRDFCSCCCFAVLINVSDLLKANVALRAVEGRVALHQTHTVGW